MANPIIAHSAPESSFSEGSLEHVSSIVPRALQRELRSTRHQVVVRGDYEFLGLLKIRVTNKDAPAGADDTPEAGPQGGRPMANRRILENALTDEVRRSILRESLTRYRNEIVDDEERMLLFDRIRRLRRQLKLA